MYNRQKIIEYFMVILDLEREMESESNSLMTDIPNGELKNLISSWHADEARHVIIAQETLNLVVTSLK